MKTFFASLLLALAVGACSSDNAAPLVTSTGVNSPQGGACTTSADCESNLTCGYPVAAAGSCSAKGTCIAMGPCSAQPACTCGKTPAATTVCMTPSFSPVQITGNLSCVPATTGGGDGGSGTTGGATTGG